MPKLPRITAKEIISILEKSGFVLSRQSGSHKIYKNVAEKRVTVPYHSNNILHPKIIKSIIKDMDISIMDLKKLL
ncbi:type II toxin-antitoxin system HicA family toxin [Candidatus Wolfebacteria bacterium]|nr:type II toxin-antitoxin system HicA family toxin [Candidatus Wolfebacteria bacterium]